MQLPVNHVLERSYVALLTAKLSKTLLRASVPTRCGGWITFSNSICLYALKRYTRTLKFFLYVTPPIGSMWEINVNCPWYARRLLYTPPIQ